MTMMMEFVIIKMSVLMTQTMTSMEMVYVEMLTIVKTHIIQHKKILIMMNGVMHVIVLKL